MNEGRGSTMRIRILVVAVLVLVAAACSASGDGTDDGATTTITAGTTAVDETVTTDPPEALPEKTADPGEGDFSVLMVANVDELTAAGTLESLQEAGFDGFVMEGSAEEGFDVYNPGLTNDEALELVTEIFSVPDVNGGLIFETANLP